MRRTYVVWDRPQCEPYRYYRYKPYGCLAFLGDVFMIVITGGLWLIWIFIREMRRR